MKDFYALLVFLLLTAITLSAQSKYVIIENRQGKPKRQLSIGDQFRYQLKGEDFYHIEYIQDLYGDGQFIVTNHNIVKTIDIEFIQLELPRSAVLSSILKGLGASLFLAGIASVIYEDTSWEAFAVGAATYGVGELWPKGEKIKTIRFDKGMFLKVVDFEGIGEKPK